MSLHGIVHSCPTTCSAEQMHVNMKKGQVCAAGHMYSVHVTPAELPAFLHGAAPAGAHHAQGGGGQQQG